MVLILLKVLNVDLSRLIQGVWLTIQNEGYQRNDNIYASNNAPNYRNSTFECTKS